MAMGVSRAIRFTVASASTSPSPHTESTAVLIEVGHTETICSGRTLACVSQRCLNSVLDEKASETCSLIAAINRDGYVVVLDINDCTDLIDQTISELGMALSSALITSGRTE